MLPEASGQDPAATSLSSCLALVEIEETREADGSVTAQRLESYPVSISVDFWAHLSAFIQQRVTNQQQVPVRRWIDSAHTVYVEELLHHQFVILLERCRADMAAFYLQLHQEVASKRVQMCSHARERLQSRETPLTTPEVADLGSLDDEEILNDVLRLARESESEIEGANYARALEFVQPRLPQPRFEWQTVPLDPHVTRRTTWRVIEESDRVKLFLLEVLGITNEDISTSRLPEHAMLAKLASLLEVSSLADTLGEKLATALANELQASFTDQNEKLIKDFVLREDDILQPLVNMLVSSVYGAKIANRVSLQARKVLATKNHSEVKRSMEQEFHRISSGRYSWLKELQKLRISNDDMAGLLLDEHEACPWVYYTEVHSDEVQTFERPLLDHHLNGCAHSLLETGEKGLGSRLRVAAISNTSSPASSQDIEIITNLHKLCGLAGFLPASRKEETWNNFVVFEEEEDAVARVSFNDHDYSGVLERTIATLGGLCTAFEKAQHLGLCCNSYTVFCRQREYSLEAFRIQISVAWQLLESLRSVLETPESWNQTASSMLRDHSPLHSALQPLLFRRSWTWLYTEADATTRKNWLHFCSLAAQFLSLAFLSYTQAHKDELFPSFLAKPLGRIVLCGASEKKAKIEMATRPLTCNGDMLGTSVIGFRLLSFFPFRRDDIGPNRWRKLDIYANLADIVDTWGPAELLCASSDQGPFAMRIGGGILYTEDDHENQYHWSESVDLDKVSQREMDLVGKLLIGAVHVNSGCQSDYGALRGRSRLHTLGTQEQSYHLTFENFSFSLGQLFSVVVQASVKHSAGVSHKKTDRETAQHHVMSLLDYRSAVQVSYCTGTCQRVRFRDMVADLLPQFGPETVHSVDEATAWEQLLATKVDVLLKGDDDVRLKDQKHQRLLKQKVEEMFDNLFHSGMNADRTLRVAWPSREDRHAYSPVPCNGTNAWAKLLSDSTHISSYAYIAPHCLQAGRGSACQSGWEPATGLSQVRAFATRVQCVNAVKSVAELPHESICFFQLMRIIVFAQVHHPDGEPVLLRVILHTVRASVVRRVIAIWHRTGTTITQVQESRDGATRAEEVLIVCGWDA
ncbi:hypothetical protein BBAD15_g2668 [Beauveria bassiana D1-5]|uniref:Uncharacterized protein n=1 Tax=Beauveria bassiana D1-5 TaxID=1245745 RepID=A0A0A2VUM5_BEABA|nr:hypothetical protein BBAD15_g2668 [Beauveria bassiana D1-5]